MFMYIYDHIRRHLIIDDVIIVYCLVNFILLVNLFTTYLCQFQLLEVLFSKYDNILLLIELKYKLLDHD